MYKNKALKKNTFAAFCVLIHLADAVVTAELNGGKSRER